MEWLLILDYFIGAIKLVAWERFCLERGGELLLDPSFRCSYASRASVFQSAEGLFPLRLSKRVKSFCED